jgi:DNA-binding transcriptional regulator YiaG
MPVPPGQQFPAGQNGHQGQHGESGQTETFAEWMSSALRREGLTQEAAARQLGVSVKTVSRWVGGATEPRMRDLRRIQEVFGEVPLP